ncbi:MAG: hypothetical protein ACOX71_06585 [Lachnospiraceae bacterium]|jgi:hypothetical protein
MEKEFKPVINKETFEKNIDDFKNQNGKFTRNDMTVDWMNTYVSLFAPETAEQFICHCISFPLIDTEEKDEEGKKIFVKDEYAIRDYFLHEYFPKYVSPAPPTE